MTEKLKSYLTIAILMFVCAVSAFAKKKQDPPPPPPPTPWVVPTYDMAATMSYQAAPKSDSEAHMTVDGTTYDAYCNTSGSSISCSDSNSGIIQITFQHGKWTSLEGAKLVEDFSHCDVEIELDAQIKALEKKGKFIESQALQESQSNQCDPLLSLAGNVQSAPVTFHYRAAAFPYVALSVKTDKLAGFYNPAIMMPSFCVGFTLNGKDEEACYEVHHVFDDHGMTLYPEQVAPPTVQIQVK